MRRVSIVVLLAVCMACTGIARAAVRPVEGLSDRGGGAQYRAFD